MSRPPNNAKAALAGGGSAKAGKDVNAIFLAQPSPEATANIPAGGNKLVANLDRARRRLDRGTFLLGHALDVRSQLYFGCDLDEMVAQVDDLRRAADAYRRGESAS